ncbi:transposase [Cylindrospermum stagnale PCC 7417]|uniref:Transposase n=1 Tax=Cylindrospermum stagnale PCC 7417 TaxID=56107 RepID=K9WYG1_9NOST|nr:IS630 family transposase [Cylindrospermum stagnale]AFZ24859.1 transposase [Cylindrospermum stagnale PCC 7417]
MKPYSLDFRQKIFDTYLEDGISQRQLAKRFCVSLSFIQKLLKQYRETTSIAPKVRTKQTPPKLNKEQLNILEEILEAQNDATLSEIRSALKEKTGITIGISTVDRMLQRIEISLKKTLHASEKETERVQLLRVQFWLQLQGISAENLIFIDEAGANLSLIRHSARSKKGKRAHGSRPQKRCKNVSIIGAIALQGVISQYSILGATDGLTFEAYISQKLVPNLWKGAYVIMDNCSIHKSGEIEKLIEAAGAKLIYLPPYSPDFSPIENCWSKIKNILRSIGARSYPDLAKAIETAFSQVSLNEIHNWFTHSCYCTSLD